MNNNNNNSCNNNISCNHNSSFSNVFYKVIHNKYIFNLIFNHIHSRYDNYNQTRFKKSDNLERFKFKDIVSLEFMVENKLYQLIKCKLEANEYINADSGYKCWLNDVYIQDRELSIEIVKLLLKSTTINNPDDPFRYIHLLNQELIQVATDPSSPHSIQVQPYMIENAFNKSTIPQIKALLDSLSNNNRIDNNHNNNHSISSINSCNNKSKRNLDNIDILYNSNNNNNDNITLSSSKQSSTPAYTDYITQFKNQIVNKAAKIKDPFQRDIALESILSNSQYYSIPPSTTPSSDIQLIDIQDIIFGVISVNVQNQLLDLNYYYIPESLSTYTDQINNIINNSNSSNNNQSKYQRSKELLELFRDNEKFFVLVNINSISDWFYNLEKLQLMVSNNQDDWRGWNIKIEQYINSINLAESEEHIKYYQSLKQIQELNHINQYINNRASEQLSQHYNSNNYIPSYIYKSIESLKNNSISNSNYNNNSCIESLELDIKAIITNINRYSESYSTMDIYYSLSSLITLQYESNNITTTSNQINFGSIDNYRRDQHRDINRYSQQSTPFRILISWIKVFITSIKFGSNDRIILLLKLNFNPIIQHHQLFKQLWYIDRFLETSINDDIPVFEEDDQGKFKHNYQIFKQSEEYSERDPNGMVETIKVLLNNYQQHQQDIIAIQQQHQQKLQNMKIGSQHNNNDKETTRYQEDYVIFKKKQREMISKLSAPDLVINYLFRMLIQSNGEIQLDTIKSIYKLINDSNIIKVQQSTLFSIYYLSLKSKYFIKYIATSPYLLLPQIQNYDYFYCLDATLSKIEKNYPKYMPEFDPSVFIDPQVFTFEFVLLNKNSFINILKALVDRYMVKLFQEKSRDNYIPNQFVNHTLSFILEVREFDLFFNYLEQLKNHKIKYFNQHIQFTESLFESIVLNGLGHLAKLLKEYQPQFKKLIFNKINSTRITCQYYHEINSIIPVTKLKFYNDYILSHSDVVVKIHALLFGDNKITDYKFGRIDFNHYSIDQYKILKNQYPKRRVFKLSKSSITQLIQSSSIIKLKQLYQNRLIKDRLSNNEEHDKLLSYLKSQLKQLNLNCNWL